LALKNPFWQTGVGKRDGPVDALAVKTVKWRKWPGFLDLRRIKLPLRWRQMRPAQVEAAARLYAAMAWEALV